MDQTRTRNLQCANKNYWKNKKKEILKMKTKEATEQVFLLWVLWHEEMTVYGTSMQAKPFFRKILRELASREDIIVFLSVVENNIKFLHGNIEEILLEAIPSEEHFYREDKKEVRRSYSPNKDAKIGHS